MKNRKLMVLIPVFLLISCSSNTSVTNSYSSSNDSVNSSSVNSSSSTSSKESESLSNSSSLSSIEESSSLTLSESSSSTVSSSNETTSSNEIITKYKVNFVANEYVRADIVGKEVEFAAGSNVMFNYSLTYGYKLNSFAIKDSSNNDIPYVETSYVTFVMPSSEVNISFDVSKKFTLDLVNGDHSIINVVDKNDYYDEGNEVHFTVDIDNKYELDTLKVYKIVNNEDIEVDYQTNDNDYSFLFANTNMKIVVIDKAKAVSIDPFTNKVTYEGDWSYYDGYTDYTMRLRIVFNGDGTLSWYLTYDYEEEYWDYAYVPNKEKAKPSDMVGSLRDSNENIEYIYDATINKINFVAKIGSKEVPCVIKLNITNDDIKSIVMETKMGGEYYQTDNKTLNRK